MAEKGSIVIPITLMINSGAGTDASGGETVSTGNGLPQNEADQKQKKAEDKAKSGANAAKAIVRKIGGELLSTALSGYGDITGNYVQGSNIQTAISEGTKLASSLALGWAGVAMYAVDKVVQGYQYYSNLKKSEMQSKFAQKRVYGASRQS